ncbi:MAG: FG-GAP repeat domain-containing protein, partial [Planctomycetota bacterium]
MARLVLVILLAGGCARDPGQAEPAPASGDGRAWFVDVSETSGLEFTIDRSLAGDYFMPDSLAAGCGLLDYDGDGDLDLYLANAFREGEGRTSTAAGADRLYRQEDDGRFTDVTAEAGTGNPRYGKGVATGDIDNDGDVDIYVANYGLDCLYRNDGDGSFTEITGAAGITNEAWSVSAGFG